MERIRRSIALTKASLGVLRSDKELLVFPVLSFVALVVNFQFRHCDLLRDRIAETPARCGQNFAL